MKLYSPLKGGLRVTGTFGPRQSFKLPNGQWTLPFHYGIDWAAPSGTPIYAAHAGVVHWRGWDHSGYGGGNQVAIRSGKYTTWYLHMRAPAVVAPGARVKAGQLIGYVGTTGASTGAHLHLELHVNGQAVNPQPYLNKAAPKPVKGKGTKVKHHYQRRDKTANGKGKRVIKPGTGLYLNERNTTPSNATNIVGGIGYYSITPHLYIKGTPGDVVELKLIWQDTKAKPRKNSAHYIEQVEIGANGLAKRSVESKRHVSRGYAVYVRVDAPKTNKGNVDIQLLASDAYLFG